ncbi:MAG: outer membrane protein precursor [Pseudomonadota bacterium]|jgi:OOP family OmpA-OmpF porin
MKLSNLAFAMLASVTATSTFAYQTVGQVAGQKISSYTQSTGQAVGQMTNQMTSQVSGQGMPSSQSMGQMTESIITAGEVINNGGYIQDSSGFIVRNSSGLCVRTGYWTPELAQPECEGGIPTIVVPVATPYVEPYVAPYVAPIVAEPVISEPVIIAAPVEMPKPVVSLEKVTFAADAFFDTDKAILKSEAKVKLDDLAQKVRLVSLEVIVAVGHTDSDASDAYNDKLSMRRAAAVKAYLVSKGIDSSRVLTEGKGEKQPVASNATKAGKAKNRRVEIEVVGTRSVNK